MRFRFANTKPEIFTQHELLTIFIIHLITLSLNINQILVTLLLTFFTVLESMSCFVKLCCLKTFWLYTENIFKSAELKPVWNSIRSFFFLVCMKSQHGWPEITQNMLLRMLIKKVYFGILFINIDAVTRLYLYDDSNKNL